MPVNLHGRSFLKLLDFSPAEVQFLLNLANKSMFLLNFLR